jgi:hypothetical protein
MFFINTLQDAAGIMPQTVCDHPEKRRLLFALISSCAFAVLCFAT